jgi:hypothetical protein
MLAQSGERVRRSLDQSPPGGADAVEKPVSFQGGADLGAADLLVGLGVFAA